MREKSGGFLSERFLKDKLRSHVHHFCPVPLSRIQSSGYFSLQHRLRTVVELFDKQLSIFDIHLINSYLSLDIYLINSYVSLATQIGVEN